MGLRQELASWRAPVPLKTSQPPKRGEKAPGHPALVLPEASGVIVVFLRHCGCPFAEKAYRELCDLPALQKGELSAIVVSHSSREATDKWIKAVQRDKKRPLVVQGSGSSSSEPTIKVIVDEPREIYAAWGLGVSSASHFLGLSSLKSVLAVGMKEGIWNRPTESGSRWQTAGEFAVDRDGVVRWAHVYRSAGDGGDMSAAVKALEPSSTDVN